MKVQQLAHLVLRVRDPDASAAWYKDVLGLHETYRIAGRMVFLTARDDSSHELALMGLGPHAPGPEAHRVGLYHFAWQLATYDEWVAFQNELDEKGIQPEGIGDHGISIGTYLKDPDGNEIEVFYELPKAQWPQNGKLFEGHFPHPDPST